jgi:hypothetical protein
MEFIDPKGVPEGTVMQMGKKMRYYQIENRNWKIIDSRIGKDLMEKELERLLKQKIVISFYKHNDSK